MNKSPAPPKKPKTPEPAPDTADFSGEDWRDIAKGVALFNSGKFAGAGEAWEQVWSRHTGSERGVFHGSMKMASAFSSGRRPAGAQLDAACKDLAPFGPEFLGIRVDSLLQWMEEGKKRLRENGGPGQPPRLEFTKPSNPDLIVELREILMNEKFVEGSNLFNTGYYWEAHEAWEDLWREQEGEGKRFLEGFVQMASAYSFLKLKKVSSAQYLFEKSLEKFEEYEHVECPLPLEGIRQALLETVQLFRGNGEHAVVVKPPVITLLKDTR